MGSRSRAGVGRLIETKEASMNTACIRLFCATVLVLPLAASEAAATAIVKAEFKSPKIAVDPRSATGTICTRTSVNEARNANVTGVDPKIATSCTIHPDPHPNEVVVNIEGGVGTPAKAKATRDELNDTWSLASDRVQNVTTKEDGGIAEITAGWSGVRSMEVQDGQQVVTWGATHALSGTTDPYAKPSGEPGGEFHTVEVAGEVLDPFLFDFTTNSTLLIDFALGSAGATDDPDGTLPSLFLASSGSRERNHIALSVSLTPSAGAELTLNSLPFEGELFTLFLDASGVIDDTGDIDVTFRPGEDWSFDPTGVDLLERFIYSHLEAMDGGFGIPAGKVVPLFRDRINPSDPNEVQAPFSALRFGVTPGLVEVAFTSEVISSVPEPSTLSLLVCGIVIVVLISSKRLGWSSRSGSRARVT